MAELSNVAAELSKGKNVDMNLPKYADGMNSLYGRIGYVKLALNLYSFAEVYGEDTEYTQLVSDYAQRLANIITEGISGDDTEKNYDGILEEIDSEKSLSKEWKFLLHIRTDSRFLSMF